MPARLPTLGDAVEILRDAHGIPHVFARTARDAFVAQGFVHAQDRLWQLVLDRAKSRGRSAELVGPAGVTFDAFARRMELHAAAAADHALLDRSEREPFEAYAEGVNAFLATGRRPIELELCGHEPEPWTAVDLHAAWKVRHVLMGSMGLKLFRARLRHAFGDAAMARFASPTGREELLIVPPRAAMRWEADLATLSGVPDAAAADAVGDGSNSWVLSGARTRSGAPMLAGDPHRTLEFPNVYVQMQLVCDAFDVVGFTMPGVPGFPHFGHAGAVACSITHAMADDQDLFLERFDGEARVRDGDAWLDCAPVRETIRVADGDDVEIERWRTPRGPIVFGDPRSGSAIALRWTGADRPRRSLAGLGSMLRARTALELEDAMRDWVFPCNSLLIADRDGAIRYLHRGLVPIRGRANAWVPVAGDDPDAAWRGEIPFEQLPRCADPEGGVIVTANIRVIDDGRYYALDYAAPNRAARIFERLDAIPAGRADRDAMEAIHGDLVSRATATFVEHLRAAVDEPLLDGFDATMDLASPAALLAAIAREQLLDLLLDGGPLQALRENPFPEEPLRAPVLARLRSALPRLLGRTDLDWLTDGRSWETLLAEAHARARAELAEAHGADPAAWRYAAVRDTYSPHALSKRFPDAGLDPPRVAVPGDADTVFAAAAELGAGVYHVSVARYVFDLADRDASGWVVPFGATGDPTDPHAHDQQGAWAGARLIPIVSDRRRLETEATTETLEPGHPTSP
jgi:penicillin amidase